MRFSRLGGIVALVFAGWIFCTIVYALAIQPSMYYGANPVVRPRLEVQEAFQSGGGGAQPAEPLGESALADAALEKQRDPYLLIQDRLTPAEGPKNPPYTAQRCHEADFQARLERVGNYRQLTNNYMRDAPDSCLQAPEEMIQSFYKTDALPASEGCLAGAQVGLGAA